MHPKDTNSNSKRRKQPPTPSSHKRKSSSAQRDASGPEKRRRPSQLRQDSPALPLRSGGRPVHDAGPLPRRAGTPRGRRTTRPTYHDPDYRPAFDSSDARHAVDLASALFKTGSAPIDAAPRNPLPVPPSPSPVEEPRTALLDGREGDTLRVILDRAAVYGLRDLHDLRDLLNLKDESSVNHLLV